MFQFLINSRCLLVFHLPFQRRFLSDFFPIFSMVFCYCGRVAIVRTSWTDTNPGRRFHCCPKQVSRCAFFAWLDPPMCARYAMIIHGLLRNINNGEG
ncbi:hypothetical protein LXL04_010238 [Taraxacum kok-saghyz]